MNISTGTRQVKLTEGERYILEKMNRGIELTQAIPGGWWIGMIHTLGRIGWSLVRKILISDQQGSNSKIIYYCINSRGIEVLANQKRGER